MPAKRMGCLRNFLAVVFTTVVTPVLANVIAQDVKDWQDNLQRALTSKTAAHVDWSRPVVEAPARPESYPPRPPSERKPCSWHWAAGAWGQ